MGKGKPKLPTGLVQEVKQLPESREMATIRFHVPAAFFTKTQWAAWKARPDKQVQEWVQSKVLHVTYGWAVTNQTCRSGDKEEFLVGYAKTPVASLDGVLSRSGACGVFVSRIAKESPEKHFVQWIDCDSLDPVSYLKSVLSSASSKSAPVAWRPGLGIRPKDAPTEKPISVWRVKGVPIQWTDDDLFKVMKEAGWAECAVVAYPTKRIRPWLVRCRPPFVVLADVAAVRCEDVFLSLEKATSRSTKRETTKVPVPPVVVPPEPKKAAVHVHNVALDASQDLVAPTAMDTDGEAGQEEHLDDQSMGIAAKRSTESPAPGENPRTSGCVSVLIPKSLILGPCWLSLIVVLRVPVATIALLLAHP